MAGGEIPLLPTWFYLVREGGTPRRSIRGGESCLADGLAIVELKALGSPGVTASDDSARWGVWLGRHIC